MVEKETSRLSTIDKYAARSLMVSFFLPMQLQVVMTFAMCSYFVFRTFQAKERIPASNYLWALFLGAGYLLYVVAIPFTPSRYVEVLGKLCEYRLSYLLLPIVFALTGKEKLKIIFNEFTFFIYAALVVCIAANVGFILKYIALPTGFHGVTHVAFRVYFEELTGHHPTYMTMYFALSAGYLLVYGEQMNRVLKYVLFYSIIVLSMLLLAKAPLIALVPVFIHQAWLRRKKLAQYKWAFVSMLLLIAASYILVPFVSQRVNELFKSSSGTANGNFADNSIYERKMIWNVDIGMLKNNWVAGVGPGKLMYLLRTRYFFYSVYYGRDVHAFDPHNEYFYQWLSFGLLGIILFLLVLAVHFTRAISSSNYMYLYLLFTLAITFFTESVLTTQHGLIFYSFFTGMFFFLSKNKAEVDGSTGSQ